MSLLNKSVLVSLALLQDKVVSAKSCTVRLVASITIMFCLCSTPALAANTTTIPELDLSITLNNNYKIYTKHQQVDTTFKDVFTNYEDLLFIAFSEEDMLQIQIWETGNCSQVDLSLYTDSEIEKLMEEREIVSGMEEFSTFVNKSVITRNSQKYFSCYGIMPNSSTSNDMYQQYVVTINNSKVVFFQFYHYSPSNASIEKAYNILDAVTLLDTIPSQTASDQDRLIDAGRLGVMKGVTQAVLVFAGWTLIWLIQKEVSKRKRSVITSDILTDSELEIKTDVLLPNNTENQVASTSANDCVSALNDDSFEDVKNTTVDASCSKRVSYCKNCGEKLSENGNFCSKCGTRVHTTYLKY